MEPNVIHIEGLDRTGKDTLRRHLVKESNGNYLVVVRSFLSQVAYARIYNRVIDEEFFINQALNLQKNNHSFVYLTANDDLISKRIIDTQEKDITSNDIKFHKEIFLKVIFDFARRGVFITIIDTSDQDLNRMFLEIQNAIIQNTIQSCSACDLCDAVVNKFDLSKGTGKLVADVKNINPKYLIVGMDPSKSRYPFNTVPFEINTSGKNEKFREILQEQGILDNCVITNLVKCTHGAGWLTYKDYVTLCQSNIKREIEFFKPEYLIALGKDVYKQLVENKLFNSTKIIEIYHPAYCYSYGRLTHEQYKEHIISKLK